MEITRELEPGLAYLPVPTPTLPPATTTNAVFADGLIVDPAPSARKAQEILAAAIEERVATGWQPEALVLTHHHHDHVGAARAMAERFNLPIWAHPRLSHHRPELPISRPLIGGTRLGRWEVLHTPGHASDHICLWDPARRALIVGDMVAETGTILVEPPDGDMQLYLDSLKVLRALNARTLIAAHGEALLGEATVSGHFDHYIAHRLRREALVYQALTQAPQPLAQIAATAYPELDPKLRPLAIKSTHAHLNKLVQEGRVTLYQASEGPLMWLQAPGTAPPPTTQDTQE